MQHLNCTKKEFLDRLEEIVDRHDGVLFSVWLNCANNSFTITSSNKYSSKKGFPTKYVGEIKETSDCIEINGQYRLSIVIKILIYILLLGVVVSLICGRNVVIYDFNNSWPILVVFLVVMTTVEIFQRKEIQKILSQAYGAELKSKG